MTPMLAIRRWFGSMKITAQRFQPVVEHRQETLAFF